MENKNIIIILVVIIVILAAAVGVVLSQQMAKEKSNLKIADKSLNVDDALVVKLTDFNGNPISNETIKIKLTDKKGLTTDKEIKTNSKGQLNPHLMETVNIHQVPFQEMSALKRQLPKSSIVKKQAVIIRHPV